MALSPDQEYATQWGRANGILSENEEAVGGLLDSKLASNPALRSQYQAALSGFRNQSGAMPANIEPLHQFEKTALTKIGDPTLYGGGGMVDGQALLRKVIADPSGQINKNASDMMQRSGQFFDEAGQQTALGSREIGAEDINARLNPFIQNVIDSSINRLSESGEKAKAAINAQLRQRGGASFGDNVSAQRISGLDKELLSKEGDIRSGYSYQGYNDAVGQAQKDRERQLSAAQIYGGLGGGAANAGATAQGIQSNAVSSAISLPTTLFDMGKSQTQTVYDSLDRQQEAGSFIRNYNQGINDIVGQDYLDAQNYPRQNIAATQSLIKPYESQVGADTSQTGTSKAGGILGSVGKVLGGFL